MNALSAAAELALNGAFADGAAPVWGGTTPPGYAILMTSEDLRLFLRSSTSSSEALIFVCGADTDVPTALDQGRTALSRIAAAG